MRFCTKLGGCYVITGNNDHRVIGPKLGLFHIEECAAGSIFWHNNGLILYRIIEDYIREQLRLNEYEEVRSPQLFKPSLWEASGHIDHYDANIFHADDFILKPMNCPAHAQIFKKSLNSYRDLPRRIAEFGCCHRNEPSGSLHGLMRVRQFVQDDAHIFCEEQQIEHEISRFCSMLKNVYKKFGFNDVRVALSLRPDDHAGSSELWDRSESILEQCLKDSDMRYIVQPREGAFYGPKLEFSLRDSQDRWWQCGTLQLDFVLPEKLNVEYVDRNGDRRHPVMIHRAILGSMERFIAILLEHYGKDLPPWLSPIQCVFLPISDNHSDYCRNVVAGMLMRSEVISKESINKRVRNASKMGIPYIVVVGDKEIESGQFFIKGRNNNQLIDLSALQKLKE